MKPNLSICLCAYNDAKYLELFFRSLFDHAPIMPFEVCLVDNASTDNTQEVVERWAHKRPGVIKCYIMHVNLGVRAVNTAVQMSSGKYIVDVNSDMMFLPLWANRLLHKLRSKGEEKTTVSPVLIEPYDGNPEYYFIHMGRTPENFDYEAWRARVSHPSFEDYLAAYGKADTRQFSHPILMLRSTWDAVGGISEDYPFPGYATDVDLGAKLLTSGYQTVMTPLARVYHFSSATMRSLKAETGLNYPSGEAEFKKRWGMSITEFYEKYQVRQPC